MFAEDVTPERFAEFEDMDARVIALLSWPRCMRCRIPTPDEFVDPYWWEAGERVCDDCGQRDRPGPHPHRKKSA